MEPKFNFYDFVGYFIPGTILSLLFIWLGLAFFSFPFSIELGTLGESIIFISISYCFGHLIQSISKVVEKKLVDEWGGWFSEQYIRDDNTHYTVEFKKILKDAIKKRLGLSYNGISLEREERERREEIFNLCYSLNVQENIAQHTEIFLGLYSLYRGLIVVWKIGIIFNGLIILKHITLAVITSCNLPLADNIIWVYDNTQLALGIILLTFFCATHNSIIHRLKSFSQRFSDSVYRDFFIWHQKGNTERPQEK